ncbi:hypothetical protein F8S09_16480 [Deinococcus sp. SDU3-2]|uniref:Uncharacterized protein n=1 Tax=Deinococcus terrestris TaxID=2651870 RepID=A0A7X1NZA4_9DEIO|nr:MULTISPECIES: hypothetical protein [Deinococcus]MPY68254.1 hypothetical protein [Deinococcus terrestris]
MNGISRLEGGKNGAVNAVGPEYLVWGGGEIRQRGQARFHRAVKGGCIGAENDTQVAQVDLCKGVVAKITGLEGRRIQVEARLFVLPERFNEKGVVPV